MDVRESIMKLAEHVGDKKVLEACKKIHKNNPNSGYISKFVMENERFGGCSDVEPGSCGVCINNVWYPCV